MSPHRVKRIPGVDGPLEVDETSRTVTKTYSNVAHETAVQHVKREVAYATRLRAAFSGVAGVSCPGIIAWDLSPPPHVVMELCPGESLAKLLRRARHLACRSNEIGEKIREGIEIYARLFAEPYYDFGFQNILFDETSGMVTFLDFVIPNRMDARERDAPLERSLGSLIGWACYDMARPANLFAPADGYMRVLRAVLAAFGGRISTAAALYHAGSVYRRLTETGSTARRCYYATLGRTIVNKRLRVLQ
jgi:hypothetical protein